MDLIERAIVMTQRHPWEVSRGRFFLNVLADARTFDRPGAVLDVGSGDAWFAQQLLKRAQPGSRVTCWDSGYSDQPDFLRTSAASDAVAYAADEPDGRFQTILLLDVLEHVEDDRGFLSAIVTAHAADDATVLISVPAWPRLFSRHDVKLRHHRRYTPAQARRLISASGLHIIREGGLFHLLLAPRALQVMVERLGIGEKEAKDLGQWTHGPLVSALVSAVLRTDNAVSKQSSMLGVSLPGLSWWALCRKA